MTNHTPTASRVSFNSVAIVVSMLAGLLLSGLAYWHFTEVDRRDLRDRILRGTQSLAASSALLGPANSFERVVTAMMTVRDAVLAGRGVDAALLQEFSLEPDPLTGESINLRYLPRVRRDAVTGDFLMRDSGGNDVPFPYPILDSQPEGLRPAADADEYYPILLEVVTVEDNGVDATGLNHFADEQFHLVMDQARDSGLVTSRTAFPLQSEPFLITHGYVALYTPGPLPLTVSERRERHLGFLSGISFVPSSSVIDFLPETYQGLEAAFIVQSEAFDRDIIDPELHKFLDAPEFGRQEILSNGAPMRIFARPSWVLRTTYATSNRWWALSIGLLFTTWICSLLFYARNRSRKLEQLVFQRTQDLAENSARLSQSETRYRMLAENVSDVIQTCDLGGICTYVSPSIAQQTGYDPETWTGRPLHEHMDTASQALLQKLLQEPERFDSHRHSVAERTLELRLQARDGSWLTIETTFTLLFDEDEAPAGFLGVSRDVTERKQNETEKSQLEAAFHQSQKMEAIGTLAGGIAHDFNNLLTGILGHAELLKSPESTKDERLKSIDVIETAALRARDLTAQLLGFARKGHYQNVPVDISAAVGDTINLLKRTIEKHISIECHCEPGPLLVMGDPGQISQVLLNLAVNARDAMPDGGTLHFELGRAVLSGDELQDPLDGHQVPAGNYCRVAVSDTGVGIEAEHLERIFEPFYTNKPTGKGTGLGLAMVYGVTRNHGGHVNVTSVPGKGSTFTLYLPLAEAEDHKEESAMEAAPASGQGTVLVIDDEELVRNMLDSMLQRLGYAVELASGGHEGLAQYQKAAGHIDLVILDMSMPRMGGKECADELRRLDPGVRIILITGYSQDSLRDEIRESHICGFLQKPFRLQELSTLLEQCLHR